MTIKRIAFFSLIFFFFLILLNLLSFAKANQNTILIKKFYEIGQAKLKFFGYKLYDVKLLSDDNIFSFDNEIKIIITYNKNFSKSQIIETSLDQIYKQNKSYPNSHINKYRKYLDRSIVDINKGDKMMAHFFNKRIIFYHNKKLVHAIYDDQFAIDFLKIWLGDNSSYPKLTKQLLNINE